MRKYILYLYTDQDKIPHKYLTFAWNYPDARIEYSKTSL